jgi:hypothetical protein
MKRIVFAVLVFASFSPMLMAGPIVVTGGGTYTSDPTSAIFFWSVSFFGTNGIDTVGVPGVSNATSGAGGNVLAGFIGATPGETLASGGLGATIDGTYYGPGFYSFGLGGGAGSISGYNSSNQVVVTESLSGYLVVTSETCSGPAPQTCSGTFAVTTPEPGSFPLMLSGAVLLALLFLLRLTADRGLKKTKDSQ